jgi:RNA-directed DNA polymerase
MEGQDRTQHEDEKLWERIFSRPNLLAALEKVRKNKGAPGIDGMTVDELPGHLRRHWVGIRAKLDRGTYAPSPVKRVEIPKPGGGVRNLGIPTVLDRFIQQAIHQELSLIFEPTFSSHSYGFRPGRSAHDAVQAARDYVEKGYHYVVDIDMAKFFDTVNHERLMTRLDSEIEDQRVLRLIKAYLKAGVMVDGMATATEEGTPQGGPLSPLLSNIVLTELDRELERREHHFVRYADDCNIYVKSQRAAERVLMSLTRFIEDRMQLQVNQDKSAAGNITTRSFLGFSFYKREGEWRISVSQKSLKRIKSKVRKLTQRGQGNSLETIRDNLNPLIIGWVNYYGIADSDSAFRALDSWLRRRMRQICWKQWKTIHRRIQNLLALGITARWAILTGLSREGPWHLARSKPMHMALPNAYWLEFGLKSFVQQYNLRCT